MSKKIGRDDGRSIDDWKSRARICTRVHIYIYTESEDEIGYDGNRNNKIQYIADYDNRVKS